MHATNRKKQINPIHLHALMRWLVVAAFVGICGLFFVYVKNQQFALGEQIRKVEREIRETRSQNQVLLAQVTTLCSRVSLQRRITEGFVTMTPIQDNCIARLLPPATAPVDGILRTASNERFRQ